MSRGLRWRKFVSGFKLTMTGVCALVAVSVLFLILGYLAVHGGTSINWNFFTKLPVPVGETGGGLANAILGSAKMLLLASIFGVPIGFFGAIYLAEFSGGATAPLLFTALGNQFWSPGWTQPTASLPVMIYTYALAPYDDWHRQAWAAGLVLLVLILVINIVARAILSRGIAVPRS